MTIQSDKLFESDLIALHGILHLQPLTARGQSYDECIQLLERFIASHQENCPRVHHPMKILNTIQQINGEVMRDTDKPPALLIAILKVQMFVLSSVVGREKLSPSIKLSQFLQWSPKIPEAKSFVFTLIRIEYQGDNFPTWAHELHSWYSASEPNLSELGLTMDEQRELLSFILKHLTVAPKTAIR